MKALKIFLCVAMMLVLCSNLFARPKKDFDNFLTKAENSVQDYSTEAYYDKFEFTNKKTGAKKKFSDFESFEKEVFMIVKGQEISQSLLQVYEKWEEELKTAEITPTNNDEA